MKTRNKRQRTKIDKPTAIRFTGALQRQVETAANLDECGNVSAFVRRAVQDRLFQLKSKYPELAEVR